jgi:hypothetical protein
MEYPKKLRCVGITLYDSGISFGDGLDPNGGFNRWQSINGIRNRRISWVTQ